MVTKVPLEIIPLVKNTNFFYKYIFLDHYAPITYSFLDSTHLHSRKLIDKLLPKNSIVTDICLIMG